MRLRAWVRKLRLALVAIVAGATSCAPEDPHSATNPVPVRGVDRWNERHQENLKRAAKKDIDLLFLGDSITELWKENAVWKQYFGGRRAANFGVAGDRTQHVLWRIDHGELDGLRPKVVVLLIGTNNLETNTAEEIASAIEAILGRIRSKLPSTKILLLGVFPVGANRSHPFVQSHDLAEPGQRSRALNRQIAALADGRNVRYLDIENAFLDANGKIAKAIMPDFLHLSEAGYLAWAKAMEPTLSQMLK